MKLLICLSLILSVFTSCSNDTVTESNRSNKSFFALGQGQTVSLAVMLTEVSRIEDLIARKSILRYNAEIDRSGIASAVYQSKVGLLLLSRDQSNHKAVIKLSAALDEYQSYMVMKRDKAILEAYFSQVALITKVYGEKLGVSVTERSWKLHGFEFSSESITPFQQIRINADAPKWSSGYGGGRAFAKIDTNNSKSEVWLVSPRYSLSGISGAKLKVENVVRSLDFKKAKIMISTNYNGGDPRESQWEEFSISHDTALEPGRWTDVTAGPYDISKYEGKEVVIGFKLTTEVSDAFTWELLSVEIWGVGSKVGQTSFDVTYKTPVPVQLYTKLFTKKLDSLSLMTQITLAGTPANFSEKERNGENYLAVSGYAGDNVGEVMLVTESFDLTKVTTAGIQVKQAINFYNEDQIGQEYLKIVAFLKGDAANTNAHVKLNFKKAPNGSGWTAVMSEELEIPSELQGKEISVGFIYKSDGKAGSASWNIYELSFYEMDK